MEVKREYLYAIPFSKAQANVKAIQRRLVRMTDTRDIRKIKNLIKFMLHSYSVKIIAIETFTRTNKGKSAPGVDNKILIKDKERIEASKLNYNRVKKLPVKRVFIPKKNGKLRPLSIPTLYERIQ
jgi:RNA-directed DNA polymerase